MPLAVPFDERTIAANVPSIFWLPSHTQRVQSGTRRRYSLETIAVNYLGKLVLYQLSYARKVFV